MGALKKMATKLYCGLLKKLPVNQGFHNNQMRFFARQIETLQDTNKELRSDIENQLTPIVKRFANMGVHPTGGRTLRCFLEVDEIMMFGMFQWGNDRRMIDHLADTLAHQMAEELYNGNLWRKRDEGKDHEALSWMSSQGQPPSMG